MDEELDGVHRSVEGTQKERRAAAYRGDKVLEGRAISHGTTDLVGVSGQRGPHQSGAAVGPSLTDDQIGGQIGGHPAGTQCRRFGTELDQQITQCLALLLGEGCRRHGRILRR